MARKNQSPPLEEGLLRALQALDQQVARELQRSPEELDRLGVRKWEPYAKRIERVSAFVIDALGADQIKLDSLLILSQALVKSLYLMIDELGPDGLGRVRSEYCLAALQNLRRDVDRGAECLRAEAPAGELI